MSVDAAHAAQKYRGDTASSYEAKRADSPKWQSEQHLLESYIAKMPKGTKALDIPCGTGRLHPLFQQYDIDATGMDINREMSDQARAKGMNVRYGDVLYIPAGTESFDVSFCIRLLNWLSEDGVKQALQELQRVTRMDIFFTLRLPDPTRQRGRLNPWPLSLIKEALTSHTILQDDEIEGSFRMITLARVG